jgi:hypothetical protein
VDKVGELGGVPQEEDRGVVKDPIPVTLLGAQLDGESTRITSSVSRARLTTDGGESDGGLDLVAHLAEERLGGDIGEIMGHFKVTVSTGTFGVHDTLRNTLAIEVGEEVDVVEI